MSDGRPSRFRRATSGNSYLSASDPRVHVGLGVISRVDRIEIRWPDETRQSIGAPGVDTEARVKAGER